VYPAEAERVLAEHAAVAEVAVVGVPHARWVETPVAFVVPADRAGATEEELIAHAAPGWPLQEALGGRVRRGAPAQPGEVLKRQSAGGAPPAGGGRRARPPRALHPN
jgi:acyl-CoA synthetase (AMP-forming)/AMP-acid ligase II